MSNSNREAQEKLMPSDSVVTVNRGFPQSVNYKFFANNLVENITYESTERGIEITIHRLDGSTLTPVAIPRLSATLSNIVIEGLVSPVMNKGTLLATNGGMYNVTATVDRPEYVRGINIGLEFGTESSFVPINETFKIEGNTITFTIEITANDTAIIPDGMQNVSLRYALVEDGAFQKQQTLLDFVVSGIIPPQTMFIAPQDFGELNDIFPLNRADFSTALAGSYPITTGIMDTTGEMGFSTVTITQGESTVPFTFTNITLSNNNATASFTLSIDKNTAGMIVPEVGEAVIDYQINQTSVMNEIQRLTTIKIQDFAAATISNFMIEGIANSAPTERLLIDNINVLADSHNVTMTLSNAINLPLNIMFGELSVSRGAAIVKPMIDSDSLLFHVLAESVEVSFSINFTTTNIATLTANNNADDIVFSVELAQRQVTNTPQVVKIMTDAVEQATANITSNNISASTPLLSLYQEVVLEFTIKYPDGNPENNLVTLFGYEVLQTLEINGVEQTDQAFQGHITYRYDTVPSNETRLVFRRNPTGDAIPLINFDLPETPAKNTTYQSAYYLLLAQPFSRNTRMFISRTTIIFNQ